MNIPQLKQILEQYFLLLNGKRAMTGDLDLGAVGSYRRLYGADVQLKIHPTSRIIYFRNRADDDYALLYFGNIYGENVFSTVSTSALRTNTGVGSKWQLQSHDGSSFHAVADLKGGFLDILRGGNISLLPSKVFKPNLPTSDPVNAGQLWNDSGTVKVSTG